IAKLRTQQYETRKNDEFAAMGNEIQRYENEIKKIEDDELELMMQADKVKAELVEEEKKAGATKESISRQLVDLDEKSKTLEARLQELIKERAELATKIEEDLLDRFDRLFESKGDAAIVALEHNVCTGCHMKVTTATVMHAKAGKEIVSCEQCGRILYSAE
ncbi:MAG TPA: C4-type zinc ribbon domain-containing protein, partial [Chthoniobacterales bacterium]|nr:C4-type zinc ribbon domain-containing protein [Chthoniobacterales bacterium]